MVGYETFWAGLELWWILPVAMIVLCVFMIRGRMGCMTCWPSSRRSTDTHAIGSSESAEEILDKRYALGEISKEEYEDKRKDIETKG
jgi:putative membrane protein